MKKLGLILAIFIFSFSQLFAQEFITATTDGSLSKKETTYVTLKDGTEIEGNISKVKMKKAQIESITIVDSSKKTHELTAETIDYMYAKPSNFMKIANAENFLTNVSNWNSDKLNQDFLGRGYLYFESTEVVIKKKTYTALMQLLNPDFCKDVKVFDNPLGGETVSIGVRGLKLAGGNVKTYYVKKEGEAKATLLTKSDYKKEFKEFWAGCEYLLNKYDSIDWTDLAKHIVEYTDNCSK